MPPKPRTTILASFWGSHAKPTRGPNCASWSGMIAGSVLRPMGKATPLTRLYRPELLVSGVGFQAPSQRTPRLTVRLGRTRQFSWANAATSSVEKSRNRLPSCRKYVTLESSKRLATLPPVDRMSSRRAVSLPLTLKTPNWLNPNVWVTKTWLNSMPTLAVWEPRIQVRLAAPCPRQSYWVVGRKFTLPTRPMAVVTLGTMTLASRGRSSREYWPRTSSSRLGLSTLVNWPTTTLVRSRSVPLLLRALTVLGSRALPVALALRALLLLWL